MKKMLTNFHSGRAAAAFGTGDFNIQHVGPFDYYNGNGWSATGQQIGPFYYVGGTDANGRHFNGTGQTIGPFSYFEADSE
jgi:hypothetical protein